MRTVVPSSYYYYYQVGSPNCQKEEIILNFTLNTLNNIMCSRCERCNILYDDFLSEFACISTQCSKEVIQIYMFKEHSYLCILSENTYIHVCNTYITGDIQFIFMSFNNRYVSGMFRSECKFIFTECAYIVFILQCQKSKINCQIVW
jgi:hypothetical protein